MRLITSILIFTVLINFSKGQSVKIDSLRILCDSAWHEIKKESYYEAVKILTSMIQQDSTFYKIYFLRGTCYLMASEVSLLDKNGKLLYDLNDSNFVKQGIKDYIKCIQLYFINPKNFPDELIGFDKEYKIKKLHLLGEIGLNNEHQDILDGLLIYLTSNRKNMNQACDCWTKAAEKNVYKIDLLIKEFCK